MAENINCNKNFNIRTAVCFFIIMLCFLSCILRVAVITFGNYGEVGYNQSLYKLEIGQLRGTIYDCNRIPLTNCETENIAAVIPHPQSVISLKDAVLESEREKLENLLSNNIPFTIKVEKEINCDTVATVTRYIHTTPEMSAAHLIGYTDNSGHGISGLEKAFDDILYSEKSVNALFIKDGLGNVLPGGNIEIKNDTSVIASGVVCTIDINIQQIAESAADALKKGAVVVSECESGKIRAMVSKPDFDPTNISDYLSSDDSPLYNRCTAAYNVGSAFKPCVVAAALENNININTVFCEGYKEIADRHFNCHKRDGHGEVDYIKALSQSCNVFFYETALKLGNNKLYNMASSLSFGQGIKLCDNYSTSAGNLTSLTALQNDAELANLSIGQGRLLLSPISMLTLYSAIATNGSYRLPTVTEGILSDGSFEETKVPSPTKVMSEKTAEKLRNALKSVVDEGTGKKAKPKKCIAAGKTATAQTGKYRNGIEITHSWFCGFFPANDPKYTVIVLSEGSNGSAEVFAKVADGIYETEFQS